MLKGSFRMSWLRGLLTAFVLFLVGVTCVGAEDDLHAEDRKELLALMKGVEASINAGDVDGFIGLMTDDVRVIWLNAEVSRGKPEVKAYYQRMVGGPGAILKSYRTTVSLGAPARFLGEVAVADGGAADEFVPHGRDAFRLDSRWSTTLRKIDGQWRIATLHLSSNVFTNALLAEAERLIWITGALAALAGILVGVVLCRLLRSRSARRA